MSLNIKTPLKNKKSLYSDFHKDLTINPISSDLAIRKDEASVKEALKNLLLTDRGERPFQPTLGGNVRATLFENNTPATIKVLEERVREVINNFEPRVNLLDVEVLSNYNDSYVQVKVYFYVQTSQDPVSVTVFLERTR